MLKNKNLKIIAWVIQAHICLKNPKTQVWLFLRQVGDLPNVPQ